jgi:hypothetical protein
MLSYVGTARALLGVRWNRPAGSPLTKRITMVDEATPSTPETEVGARSSAMSIRRAMARCAGPAGLLLLATCSDPLGPEERACSVPPNLQAIVEALTVQAQQPSPAAIRSALVHAAGPMAAVIGASHLTAPIAGETMAAAESVADGLNRSGCHHVVAAATHLDNLPDDPATRPDRDGIRMILAIAANALADTQ